MANVFRARHVDDGEQLAIKTMRRPDGETGRRRFLREARLLAEIHHPNVLRILDVGVHGNERFLVTELIDGVDLTDLAHIPCARALAILRRVADGLAAIHARG